MPSLVDCDRFEFFDVAHFNEGERKRDLTAQACLVFGVTEAELAEHFLAVVVDRGNTVCAAIAGQIDSTAHTAKLKHVGVINMGDALRAVATATLQHETCALLSEDGIDTIYGHGSQQSEPLKGDWFQPTLPEVA